MTLPRGRPGTGKRSDAFASRVDLAETQSAKRGDCSPFWCRWRCYSSLRTRLSLPRGSLDLDQGLCCLRRGARPRPVFQKVDHTKPQLQPVFVRPGPTAENSALHTQARPSRDRPLVTHGVLHGQLVPKRNSVDYKTQLSAK